MRRWRWATCVVVSALIGYGAVHVDWRSALHVLGRASFAYLAAAMLCNGASLVLRGIRWWIFLRAVDGGSLMLAIRGAVVGSGFNNLLVANGGEAARALFVSREGGASRTSVVATLALERLFDPICFLLLLVTATFTTPLPSPFMHARAVAISVLLFAAFGFLISRRAPTAEVVSATIGGWRAHVRGFRWRVAALATPPRVISALACSIGVWMFQLFEYAVVACAAGVQLPFGASVAAMVLINAGLVFRATPGGVGYFQLAYATAVSRFGIPTDVAVATALLIQIVEILPVTLAALAFTATRFRGAPRAGGGAAPRFPPVSRGLSYALTPSIVRFSSHDAAS
ncbi:MAG: lysylphosphatidylglycerol synthase transmembrane domain-containing protein [Gemmatimonadaceae bacterium]